MSIARHHSEWLSLVPVSGPFLSLPVLMEAFNTGLEPHDPDVARSLRHAYDEWRAADGAGRDGRKSIRPENHYAFIQFVLSQVLELSGSVLLQGQSIPQSLQTDIPEHRELLRPNFVVVDPSTKQTRLLVQTYPRSQELTSYVANSPWKASPDTRMTELLHATGVRLGLVTNGEHWMLVDAPKGEATGYASWYANLWLEEPITLRAFRSLLSASRFFSVPDDQTLEALLTKSASNQQEVTDQLGYQVRRAVEVLIHSLDRADQDHGRSLLKDVPETVLYESALTVMMRLVFLFCAEERELIPSRPFPVYEQNYSVSTISKQLRELADQHGEELLERRYDAWPRLLAAFRAIYGGLRHEDLHIPAYGGKLFNPDRFPFLEGRQSGTTWRDTAANPLPVNNRTVLHLLEALQLLQIKLPKGGATEARRLSFRALDIEQIGHVYEGLLDHTAKRATEPILGLSGTRDKEPEIPLAELERLLAKGESDLVKHLKDQTGKSESALKNRLKIELDIQEATRFRTACQGDDDLWKRVEPLAGLVRLDNFGYPVIIQKGGIFVTAGTDRRSSGTHYTPRILTEPIVQYTLEPLVYVGPAEGLPKNEWKLKSAKELLDLKICDMACGSGAFLVQATRFMAERLLEAWEIAKQANPDVPNITPEGLPSSGSVNESLVPDDPAERKLYAMRLIVQRCIYGVDINPLAVEMAKLSLWLLTMAKDKPFEFLDHNIRCGDSLVGLHSIEQLSRYTLKPDSDDETKYFGPWLSGVDEAIELRLTLEDMPANTIEDVQRQEQLLAEANEKMARLRCAADLLVSAEFWGESAKDRLERVRHAAVKSGHYVENGPTEEFEQVAAKERRGQKMFHWPLEFPEVIVKRGGFDAFVGNPPFLGGKKILGPLGAEYRVFIVAWIGNALRGSADLCAYFLLRASQLMQANGHSGFISTNTISEGDTREVGLAQLETLGTKIVRAVRSMKWPGFATVEVSKLWLRKGTWAGTYVLDGVGVSGISCFLTETSIIAGTPFRLKSNSNIAYIGSVLSGIGFVLEPDRAHHLLLDTANRQVIVPYLNGENVNSKADCTAARFVINFKDWPLERAKLFEEPFKIVRETVKPHRDTVRRQSYRDNWWQFAEKCLNLYAAISGLKRVLVVSLVNNHLGFAFVSPDQVFASKLAVFATEDWNMFAILQSHLHYHWAWRYSSTMRTDINYSPTDCFETFPLPNGDGIKPELAAKYYECRHSTMFMRQEGLTKTYNRFHDSDETSVDIQKLRDLHVEMDHAVSAAYGWTDLELGHGFHETKQGVRFTISEPARREVLQRLLKLNHERYAEEVKQGLHSKKKGTTGRKASRRAQEGETTSGRGRGKRKSGTKPTKPSSTPTLFDFEEDAS